MNTHEYTIIIYNTLSGFSVRCLLWGLGFCICTWRSGVTSFGLEELIAFRLHPRKIDMEIHLNSRASQVPNLEGQSTGLRTWSKYGSTRGRQGNNRSGEHLMILNDT